MSTLAPAVAGSFYPGSGRELARDVDSRLDRSRGISSQGPTLTEALIAPHAGYVYSGDVAAQAFARVRGRSFDRVIVLGPSHHFGFRGAVVPESAGLSTPIGEVRLDPGAIAALRRAGASASDRAFAPEHSIEVEVPFLQRALEPGWSLTPVLVGSENGPEDADLLADALRPLLSGALLVVSTDFTHYGPRFGFVPFKDHIPERLRDLDLGAVHLIERRDAPGFERYVSETGATICGRRAIDVWIRLVDAPTVATLAAYEASGRLTGDWSHSVSYAAIVAESPAIA